MGTFGGEVRRLRRAKKLTQKQLAAAVGVSQPSIGKIETGSPPKVNVRTLYALCRVLEVKCEHFQPYFAEAKSP